MAETRNLEASQSDRHNADVVKIEQKAGDQELEAQRSEIIEMAEKLKEERDSRSAAMDRMGENQDE